MVAGLGLELYDPDGEYVAACRDYGAATYLAEYYGPGTTVRLGDDGRTIHEQGKARGSVAARVRRAPRTHRPATPIAPLPFELDDGGRRAAGFQGEAGDCGVRAAAIALGLPYREVYDALYAIARGSRRLADRVSPRLGVARTVLHQYLERHGWRWVPTMAVGSPRRVHMRPGELPGGRIIARLSRHYAAVVDGVVRDTHDPCRGGTRIAYGYWEPDPEAKP